MTKKRKKNEKASESKVQKPAPNRKKRAAAILIALPFVATAVFLLVCILTMPDISDSIKSTRTPKITVLAADGTEIAAYGAKGSPVDLRDLPPYAAQAVIATEDIRFYKHFGIDLRSVARAVITNLVRRRKAQGASTITQQVAKNLFLSSKKTIRRKVQEFILSLWLEKKLTKDQILTVYLNRVYFGAGSYGIDAAALRYYGVRARHLSLYQAAVLAGLLKAPTTYNPLAHPEAANKRARIVLANMVKAGFIGAREALAAAEEGARTENSAKDLSKRYFTDWIANETDAFLGSVTQDITVQTTLDITIQTALTAEIENALNGDEARQKNVSQAAGVVMTHDGAVLAMVGGRDYAKSQFNRATEARRQIGSTVKPFVYLTAFQKGARPDDITEDAPLYIKGWSPKNANGKYYGKISLRQALIRSVNTVAVATAMRAGVGNVLKTARKFGVVGSDCEANAAIALGVCQTRLIDLTAAYATLANGGTGVYPYGITEIRGRNGKVLYTRKAGERARLADPKALAEIDSILEDVVREGTGKKAASGILTKGKTGTTQNYRDAWFVGYTRDMAAGIWVGNDDETPMKSVGGGSLPAEIFGRVIYTVSCDGNDDGYSDL